MYVTLRRLIIRLFLPITWRLFRRRPSDTLADFAATEADSGWQFLQTIEALDEAEHRALLFDNLLEEMEHAARFRELAARLPGGRVARPTAERHAMIEDGDGLVAFLAYAHAGELDISLEFDAYARAATVPEARTLFREIAADEDDHHHVLWKTLIDATRSEETAHKLVRAARRKRAWKAWLRFSKRLGDAFLGFWLSLIYLLFGWLLVLPSRRRLRGAP